MSELKIDHGAWVVVCDGAKALVLENAGNREYAKLEDQGSLRARRSEDPRAWHRQAGPRRSARSATATARWSRPIGTTIEEQRFLARLAARLDKAVLCGETPSLIVVAPPRAIGVLRTAFTSHVRQAIRAEVEKDYVKLPVDEITRHLMQ